ncbi:lactonase, partial [Hyaloraphidium curvatum]
MDGPDSAPAAKAGKRKRETGIPAEHAKMTTALRTAFVRAGGHRLEYLRIPGRPGRPELVFLHEGLGSVSLLRDFPARVCAATGSPGLVYSRYGYGRSDVLREARKPDYLHKEALETLPELLGLLGIERPVLVGHSDGASIALIHAAHYRDTRGVIAMAPHSFVEDVTIKGILGAKKAFETTDLKEKLGKHHSDPEKTFRGWNDVWLSPEFRSWNIEGLLPRIRCPVLGIQGHQDEYATMRQLEVLGEKIAGKVELLGLENCRHTPQRDQEERVVGAVAGFVDAIADD